MGLAGAAAKDRGPRKSSAHPNVPAPGGRARHPVALVALCLLSAVPGWLAEGATARAAALPPAAESRWIEVKSRRFEITAQADEGQARRIARHLERLAESLTATTRGVQVEGGKSVRVFVFRDHEAFVPYCPFRDDEFSGTVGYHISGPDTEYLVVYGNDFDRLSRFVAHEYLHAVVAQSFGEMPLWLNEGLAEYYSTFVARKRSVEIGRPIPEHVLWLKSHLFPVREILAISGDSPDYQGGSRRQTIYAQSWALVHALALDPEDSGRRFGRLLSQIARGSNDAVALRAIYGANAIDSLGPALRARVSLLTLPYLEHSFAVPFDEIHTETRPLEAAESLGRLGELLAQLPDSLAPRATGHLEAAWRADSSRTLPASWLATLAERLGDPATSQRWHARAIASPDPRVKGLEGDRLARRGLYGPDAPAVPAPGANATALSARALLGTALDGSPETPLWLVPLGLTYLQDTSAVAPGIGALLDARSHWPRRTEIAGALAVLNLRAGNPGAALHDYSEIPPGRDQAWWQGTVANLLLENARLQAERLMREGRFAEAESLFTPLAVAITESGAARRCAFLQTYVRDRAKSAAGSPSVAAASSGAATNREAPAKPRSAASDPAARERARDQKLKEYRTAMATRAYGNAERSAREIARLAGSAREKAGAESLAAEARCRSALETAEELARFGSAERACERIDQALADRPSAATRREAERLRARICR